MCGGTGWAWRWGLVRAALLVAFAAMQTVELRRIRRERDRANRIAEFMSNMFRVADPSESRGNTVTAREILDKAAANIGKGLTQDPEVRTQLMDLMGTVYQNLGLYAQSQALLERAVEIQKQALGPEKEETLKSESDLAWTLDHEGKYAEAVKLEREVLAAEKRTMGAEDAQTIRTMNNLGWTLQRGGHNAEAEQMERASSVGAEGFRRGKFADDCRRSESGGDFVHAGKICGSGKAAAGDAGDLPETLRSGPARYLAGDGQPGEHAKP